MSYCVPFQVTFSTEDIPPDGQARIGAISRCIEDYFENNALRQCKLNAKELKLNDELLLKCLPLIKDTFRHVMHPDKLRMLDSPHLLASYWCLNWYLDYEDFGDDTWDLDEVAMIKKILRELIFTVTSKQLEMF
jgi:hypothetical protein